MPKAAVKTKTKLHKKVKAKSKAKLPKIVEKRKNKKLERFTKDSRKTAKTPAYPEIKAESKNNGYKSFFSPKNTQRFSRNYKKQNHTLEKQNLPLT